LPVAKCYRHAVVEAARTQYIASLKARYGITTLCLASVYAMTGTVPNKHTPSGISTHTQHVPGKDELLIIALMYGAVMSKTTSTAV